MLDEGSTTVHIGSGLGLIAAGAIMRFALPNYVLGINLGLIGVILMVVGVIGLAVTVLIWGPRSRRPVGEDDVIEERRVIGRRPR